MRHAAAVLALALALAGCGRTSREVVVARIDGEEVTLEAFQAWLETALPAGGGESDEVRSRLFDAFLDERLLAREAARRGVTVGEEEVRRALGPGEAGSAGPWAERRRALARSHLAVQKLQEAFLRAEVRVEDATLESWVAEQRRSRVAPPAVTLRALKVAGVEEGTATAEAIRSGRSTFPEAARAADPDGTPTLRVSRAGLPEPVLRALDRIRPGEVTSPVSIQDGVYLFELVERHEGGTLDEAALREEGRRVLRDREASRRQRMLLEVLRREARVERETGALPFAYVPARPLE